MRIILSRKGFDSTAGGCPSPIFPDGRMLSLPIPDKRSPIAYQDLSFGDMNVGELVVELTGDAKRNRHCAHLDPDLRADSLPRSPGWKPMLGTSANRVFSPVTSSCSLDPSSLLSRPQMVGVSKERNAHVISSGAGCKLG